jgi:ATP-dependent Clp protease protease subunit
MRLKTSKGKKLSEDYKDLELVFDYDVDKESRIIYFTDYVDNFSVAKAIKSLVYLDGQNDRDISMYICSYGGYLDHMFALYDVMQQCRNDIITIGTGAICSAAVVLLVGGNKRFVTENAHLMAHQAHFGYDGNAETVVANAKLSQEYEKRRYELMARHSNWTAAKWKQKEKSQGEVWLKAEEMLEAGMVDGILTTDVEDTSES